MKTLSFHSNRGGVGKSVLSVNVAVQLALNGHKVCLIDFDMRAPSLGSFVESSNLKYSKTKLFTEFLLKKAAANEVISKTQINNLFLVFSDIEILQRSKERSKLTQHGQGRILAKLFEFIRHCEKIGIEYVIIDCMPGLTYRSLDALVVSDQLFIVTRPVRSEINGLKLLISKYLKLEETQISALVNQVENVTDLTITPDDKDIETTQQNLEGLVRLFSQSEIPLLYQFKRIPFLTERIYVLEEKNHPFSIEIRKFCEKVFK